MRSPLISNNPILHRNYAATQETAWTLLKSCPSDVVIAVVGPTRAGKSTIHDRIIARLKKERASSDPDMIPVASLSLKSSHDGRVKQKYLSMKFLQLLNHPVYSNLGSIDEFERYTPSGAYDESAMQIRLERACDYRNNELLGVDEGHQLTHTSNEQYRADLLDSLKNLCAVNRAWYLTGGYELAYRGFFDAAHFAGRLFIVEFPPYIKSSVDEMEWTDILMTLETYLNVNSKGLLVSMADELLIASNGTYGLLEKILVWAKVNAIVRKCKITRELIRSGYPPENERILIQADITKGQEALKKYQVLRPASDAANKAVEPVVKGKQPFIRNPVRHLPEEIVLDL